MILNTSEAARHLGYSTRTTLQRLLGAGLLDDYRRPGGGRAVLLETRPVGLPTLRERVQALVQIRHSSPLWRRSGAEKTPAWDAVADRLNDFLGPSWPGPPYSGDQCNTLAMALSLAVEAAGDA